MKKENEIRKGNKKRIRNCPTYFLSNRSIISCKRFKDLSKETTSPTALTALTGNEITTLLKKGF
jgi:hypothetical protein